MPFDTQIMQTFIDEHQSQYVGKYRIHSGYRNGDYSFKYRYYMLDENFRQIDIFVDIVCKDEVKYVFSENLHEQEKIYIIKDALKIIIERYKHKNSLHYTLYDNIIKNGFGSEAVFEPMDYSDIYKYMKYHKGINQNTVDDYYKLYIPTLNVLIQQGFYEEAIDSILFLLQTILYEHSWAGTTSKYLQTEYQFHLYYIREIIKLVYKDLDKFYHHVSDELFKVIEFLCQNERFSLAIMTDFGNLVLSHFYVTNDIIKELKDKFAIENEDNKPYSLVFSYIYYIFHSDYEPYHEVVLKILRLVINNMLTYANSDLDLALGNALIKAEGYQIILDLFHQDYNTFIFNCYTIDTFPKELQIKVRDELVGAVHFFSARMQNEKYKQSSFEQVMNINRLLMNNFKEWYK